MEITKIVGIGIVATILVIILKVRKPEIAVQASIATGLLILFLIVTQIRAVIDQITIFSKRASIDIIYLSILLKVIGIAYITEFGADICRDAGECAIASKIELAGKIIIVLISIPIITALLDLILNLLT